MANSSIKRCPWAKEDNPLYIKYHDEEWAVPVHDDRTLFEFLILEGAQAGLSWETILNKRAGYKKVFKNFDPKKVAQMTKREIASALKNPDIVRNRLKVESAVTNAKFFIEIQKEFGSFSNFLWGFVNGVPIQNSHKHISDVPAVTQLAEKISKELKKHGFRFVGPTIMYAYMQAVGMVNDHTVDCFRYTEVQATRET